MGRSNESPRGRDETARLRALVGGVTIALSIGLLALLWSERQREPSEVVPESTRHAREADPQVPAAEVDALAGTQSYPSSEQRNAERERSQQAQGRAQSLDSHADVAERDRHEAFGDIRGWVTDFYGAPRPGSIVVAVAVEQSEGTLGQEPASRYQQVLAAQSIASDAPLPRRMAVTNDEGWFLLSQLPLGTYDVFAQNEGFAQCLVPGLLSNVKRIELTPWQVHKRADLTLRSDEKLVQFEVSIADPALNKGSFIVAIREKGLDKTKEWVSPYIPDCTVLEAFGSSCRGGCRAILGFRVCRQCERDLSELPMPNDGVYFMARYGVPAFLLWPSSEPPAADSQGRIHFQFDKLHRVCIDARMPADLSSVSSSLQTRDASFNVRGCASVSGQLVTTGVFKSVGSPGWRFEWLACPGTYLCYMDSSSMRMWGTTELVVSSGSGQLGAARVGLRRGRLFRPRGVLSKTAGCYSE